MTTATKAKMGRVSLAKRRLTTPVGTWD
jgi:hypothetical protein